MMTQAFSILTAIIMALSGICGAMGSLGITQPVSVEVGLGVDDSIDGILAGTPVEGLAAALPKLLERTTLRTALSPSGMQSELRVDGTSLLSVSMQKQEDGWALATGLLPQTSLTVKQETLDQMQSQITSSAVGGGSVKDFLEKLNLQAILPVVITAGLQLSTAFEETFGEPETGAFTVNDVEYTEKSVSSLTLQEAEGLLLDAAQKILSDENVAAAFAAFGMQPPALSGLDFTANIPADAEFSVVRYAGEGGKTCLEISLLQGEIGFTFRLANADSLTAVTFLLQTWDGIGVDAILSADMLEKNIDLDISAAGNGRKYHLKGSMLPVEEGSDISIYLTVAIEDGEPFTVRSTLKLRNEAPAFDAGSTSDVIELEKLMDPDSGESEKLAASLETSLKTGLIVTGGKLLILFPELATMIDIGSLLQLNITNVKTETPAEEPVEVETEEADPIDLDDLFPAEDGSAA